MHHASTPFQAQGSKIMEKLAQVLIGLNLLIHLYIVVLEMVLWKQRAPKVFGLTPEFAEQTASLASNQGLYNGFLAAALALGLFLPDPHLARAFTAYGLGCIAIAGIWGAVTANVRILFVQTIPAGLALGAIALACR
jgi:putative membrane protein